jgi:hypothetical protein
MRKQRTRIRAVAAYAIILFFGSMIFVLWRLLPPPSVSPPPPRLVAGLTYDDIVRQSVARRSDRRGRELDAISDENSTEPLYVLSVGDGVVVRERPSQREPSWPREGERCTNDVSYKEMDDGALPERHSIRVDNRGFACAPWALDRESGCCVSRKRHSCLGCRLADRCCDRFALCVSCCMGSAAENRSFDECRFRCRTSSRTMMHQQDIGGDRRGAILARELPYCYDGDRAARVSLDRIHHDESSNDRIPPKTKPTTTIEFLKIG